MHNANYGVSATISFNFPIVQDHLFESDFDKLIMEQLKNGDGNE